MMMMLKVASEEEQLLEEELKLVRRLNNQAAGSTKIDMNVKVRKSLPSFCLFTCVFDPNQH